MIVSPHLSWNLVRRQGERPVGPARLPEKSRARKTAMQAVAVSELEIQIAPLLGIKRRDPEFFARLSQSSVERRLARVDFASGSVDFPRAKAAFFVDEQNLFVADDEEQIGPNARLPVCPVDHVAR
jgi:hypothetical protein